MSIIDNRVIEEQLEKQLQEYYCHSELLRPVRIELQTQYPYKTSFLDSSL